MQTLKTVKNNMGWSTMELNNDQIETIYNSVVNYPSIEEMKEEMELQHDEGYSLYYDVNLHSTIEYLSDLKTDDIMTALHTSYGNTINFAYCEEEETYCLILAIV